MPNEIPQEIVDILMETPGIDLDCSSVRCKCSGLYECTNLKGMADKLYHLRDQEVDFLRSGIYEKNKEIHLLQFQLKQKDQRIKELEELLEGEFKSNESNSLLQDNYKINDIRKMTEDAWQKFKTENKL